MLVWIVFFVLTLPICIWAAWSDLKFLKIPNILTVTLVAVFVVSGIFVLPFDEYLMRLLVGFVALLVGFLIYFTGLVGGGDIKFTAAILPFIARDDLLAFMFLISIMTLAGLAAHRLVGLLKLAPRGWESWQHKRKFPFGLTLAGSMIYYLSFNILTTIA